MRRISLFGDLRKLYFVTACFIGGYIYISQQLNLPLPTWVNNYVNDFLCMPLVLVACLYLVRFIKSNRALRIPLPVVMAITLYFAVYFEYYLPRVTDRYTSDFIDVLLYFGGATFFHLVEERIE